MVALDKDEAKELREIISQHLGGQSFILVYDSTDMEELIKDAEDESVVCDLSYVSDRHASTFSLIGMLQCALDALLH